jgi:hypothetical protein
MSDSDRASQRDVQIIIGHHQRKSLHGPDRRELHAVLAHFRQELGARRPHFIIVEESEAAAPSLPGRASV